MKHLATVAARSTWLFNMLELNPKGQRLFPYLTDALTEQYDFDDQPEPSTDATSSDKQVGTKFKNGQFDSKSGPVVVSLDLYDDGLAAVTSHSSEVTDEFIRHAISWAESTFSLKFDPSLVVNRIYVSEVVVKLSGSLADRLKPLGAFADLLSSHSFGKPPQPFSPSGITFTSGDGSTTFTLDRRTNTPVSANVFYSRALTDTATHLTLLSDLEQILGGSDD